MDSLFNMSKVNHLFIVTINIFVLFILLISIYFLLKMKIKYSQIAYLVLLISGLDYQMIKMYFFKEIASVLGGAVMASFVVTLILSFTLNDYRLIMYGSGVGIIVYSLLLICSKQLINKVFKKVDLVQLLKRG
ncbi:MAG: hypothetical protein KBT36_13655 [Kurthia sp.]|nr:hypothetical protein [Candidatus Kurthia equi]